MDAFDKAQQQDVHNESAPSKDVGEPGLSTHNKLLVVSVMVVLGCFAITALALRIGNRIIKMRKKDKKSCAGYIRSLCPKRDTQPKPKPMKVTVRMTRQTSKKSSVRSISSRQSNISNKTNASTSAKNSPTSILRHSKSLATLHDPPTVSSGTNSANNSVKRSRTMDALLDIGAFSPDFSEPTGPENILESSSEATLLCKESKHKRTRFFDEAYDNPLMMKISGDESTAETTASYGSQTELQLFMDRSDSKQSLSSCLSSSIDRTPNDSPICVITPLNPDCDSPNQSPVISLKHHEHSDGCNSESDSQNEAQRRFRLNKCLKWRTMPHTCSSKDSGYGDTTSPCTPCQDGEMLPMQDFKIEDETCAENENLKDNREEIEKIRSSLDSPTTSSPSSCYPLSSIEESPPPKARCQRCDSLYLNSDESLYEQDKPWTQNISGLLRDTLANYLYSNSEEDRYDMYNSDVSTQQYNTNLPYNYPEYNNELPQYDLNRNEPPSPSLVKKFFKKRTSTCSTQTNGPPLNKRPSVKWHCENGTYMMKPREDAGIEFLGPIYFAKSIDDFGPFLSGTMDKDMNQSVV